MNRTQRVPFGADSRQRSRRFKTTTLGCKINAYESRVIENAFTEHAWSRLSHQAGEASADLHIINTCTVTAEADRQARQAVRRAVRRDPDAVVVVTGCYAQMAPEASAEIPGVDFVVGNDRKLDIHNLLPLLESGELPRVLVGDLNEHVSLPRDILTGFEGRTRAFVQVQQGCNQGCTFCVIHQARGPSTSLPASFIRRQVQRLVMNGYREIVLCGVDLGSFGEDQGQEQGLAELVALLQDLAGDFRIRLSSIDPIHLSDNLLATMAESSRVCHHIHLSMQSGNTLILKRMKRRATRDIIDSRVQLARELMPNLTLSADIMTGFPTESDAHFADSVSAVRDLEIAWPHVFPYSARNGTPAARIPKQVDPALRKQRAATLRDTGADTLATLLRRQVGRQKRVLVERELSPSEPALARADDYCTVRVADATLASGQFVDVEIARAGATELFAA